LIIPGRFGFRLFFYRDGELLMSNNNETNIVHNEVVVFELFVDATLIFELNFCALKTATTSSRVDLSPKPFPVFFFTHVVLISERSKAIANNSGGVFAFIFFVPKTE